MQAQELPTAGESSAIAREILVSRTNILTQEKGVPAQVQVFTMTLRQETIQLLPFKNWEQLDHHKWLARGTLPASPAGLEVTPEHVKIAGETISINEPGGCERLERVVNEWLALEKGTLKLARDKAHAKPVSAPVAATAQGQGQPLAYKVELDKERQVHIRCVQGKEILAEAGLTLLGMNSLVTQGLMRKPASVKVGALHDWLELDGVLYSFEAERDDSAVLERALNERYLSSAALGQGKDVVVFTNAASSTGFDILFDVKVGGVPDRRRRPLNEETLELLQDPERCGLLHKGLVIKLTRPTLIFKKKTSDGGEQYLPRDAEHTVKVVGDDGHEKAVLLSQPVDYLHLSAVELTAVFNHPAINQHSRQMSAAVAEPAASPGSYHVIPIPASNQAPEQPRPNPLP